MQAEKVSIIIPSYNTGKYVQESIESALNQTFTNLEIIVVDDGSTDNSLEQIRKFSDRIKIITKKNGGTSSALNTGIKEMSGDWFKWLGADDILYPNAVEDLVSETKKFPNNKKIIYYSDFDCIDSKGNFTRTIIYKNRNNFSLFEQNVRLLQGFFGNPNTSLIHKETFEKYGLFDEVIKGAIDYEFWLRLCVQHGFRLHRIPKALIKYREHSEQLSNKMKKTVPANPSEISKLVLNRLEPDIRQEYLSGLEKLNSVEYKIKRVIDKTIRKLLHSQLRRGNKKS